MLHYYATTTPFITSERKMMDSRSFKLYFELQQYSSDTSWHSSAAFLELEVIVDWIYYCVNGASFLTCEQRLYSSLA